MNIVLIGMMASGKSTVGRLLANAMGRPFIDTDALVEERAGMPIPQVFAEQGEAAFRELEAAVVTDVMARDGQVVATGGGVVLRPENREVLRAGGMVFWLDVPATELYDRAVAQGVEGRPLLAGKDPSGRLAALAAARREAYAAAAHVRMDGAGREPGALADQIRALVEKADKGDIGNAAGAR